MAYAKGLQSRKCRCYASATCGFKNMANAHDADQLGFDRRPESINPVRAYFMSPNGQSIPELSIKDASKAWLRWERKTWRPYPSRNDAT